MLFHYLGLRLGLQPDRGSGSGEHEFESQLATSFFPNLPLFLDSC